MIKGLAITPPVIGRICIGKLVQKQDKWVPEKDDSFTLTTQVQQKGGWLLHPLHQHYSSQKSGQGQEQTKIRAIPVRVLFNDSDLNLRAEYSVFDRQTGKPAGRSVSVMGKWQDVWGHKAWRRSAALDQSAAPLPGNRTASCTGD
ncbi:hypothetical protein [Aeromonas sp. 601115]|uniref:recombination directionality factor n=1 Tax=Aeromonas sp. 601115 TaxID=2712038 RepID=UPI003B9DF6FD